MKNLKGLLRESFPVSLDYDFYEGYNLSSKKKTIQSCLELLADNKRLVIDIGAYLGLNS